MPGSSARGRACFASSDRCRVLHHAHPGENCTTLGPRVVNPPNCVRFERLPLTAESGQQCCSEPSRPRPACCGIEPYRAMPKHTPAAPSPRAKRRTRPGQAEYDRFARHRNPGIELCRIIQSSMQAYPPPRKRRAKRCPHGLRSRPDSLRRLVRWRGRARSQATIARGARWIARAGKPQQISQAPHPILKALAMISSSRYSCQCHYDHLHRHGDAGNPAMGTPSITHTQLTAPTRRAPFGAPCLSSRLRDLLLWLRHHPQIWLQALEALRILLLGLLIGY